MVRLLALAFGGILLLAAAVSANSGPPALPKDHKIAEPSVCLDGLEKHPDFVFFISYAHIYSTNPRTLIEVKNGKPLKLDLTNDRLKDRKPLINLTLMAMDRKEFDKRKKDDPSLVWFSTTAPGILTVQLTPPATSIPITEKDQPLASYRITLKDDKLSAEKIETKKGSDEPSVSLLPTWAFGIVSSVSVAWLGIWFARRGRAYYERKEVDFGKSA